MAFPSRITFYVSRITHDDSRCHLGKFKVIQSNSKRFKPKNLSPGARSHIQRPPCRITTLTMCHVPCPFAICHLPFAICYRGPAIGYWLLVVTLFTHRTLKIPSISKVFKAFQRKSFYPQKKAAGTLFKNLSTH